MKPWEELTDLEKREAIALRLPGWKRIIFHSNPEPWIMGPTGITYRAAGLPDWPTNDGLAFAEVWPKLCVGYALLGFKNVAGGQFLTCEAIINAKKFTAIGNGWADLICRAVYELLPITEIAEEEDGFEEDAFEAYWRHDGTIEELLDT